MIEPDTNQSGRRQRKDRTTPPSESDTAERLEPAAKSERTRLIEAAIEHQKLNPPPPLTAEQIANLRVLLHG